MTPAENAALAALADSVEAHRSDLRDLRVEMHDGFKAVNARQDVANGRTRKLELARAAAEGAKAAMSWLPTIIVGFVSGGLVAILAWALGGAH